MSMVDVRKIEVGKIYKYGELCQLFGEDKVTSNSKKSQLKEWNRFFRWEQMTTHKYKIQEIYDKPEEKNDGRRNNGGNSTSKYLGMDDCIMRFLQQNNGEASLTIAELISRIGLVVSDYKEYKRTKGIFVEMGYSEGVVNNLFWKIRFVEQSAKSAIERLEKGGYIHCFIDTVLVYNNGKSKILEYIEEVAEKEMKAQIMKDMGIGQNDLYRKEIMEKFQEKYRNGLQELFGSHALYVYRKYNLFLKGKQYELKSEKGIEGLTRRFVKEICVHMINLDYKGFYLKDNTKRQVVSLLEKLFVHMNQKCWDGYEEEDFETNAGRLFLGGFYMEQNKWREDGRIIFDKTEKVEKDDSYRKGVKGKKVRTGEND